MRKRIRLGSGAGFSGDRLDAAAILAEHGELDWLGLECLAERTIALAQLRRLADPSAGFDTRLRQRMETLLPIMDRRGFRIVTNMGAAHPLAGGEEVARIAQELGLAVKVAVVTGDDVLAALPADAVALESGRPLASYGPLVSANAYLGIDSLLPALDTGANVVVTGRVADPSLFLAPLAHSLGWSIDDYSRLARGTCVGHLLECAGQLCGGYFADPGVKDVPDMARLGFPFADVDANGDAVLGKVAGTGGRISIATVTEQLLYEVTDPHAYATPDVYADFSLVRLAERGVDSVEVRGAAGSGRPEMLKASVGYRAGHVGEGEIGYAGPNAMARARLAADILCERLSGRHAELRIDLIGSTSMHGRSFDPDERPYEVRVRATARATGAAEADGVGDEVEALFTNGPAGGGGLRRRTFEQIGIVSTLVPRTAVRTGIVTFGSA